MDRRRNCHLQSATRQKSSELNWQFRNNPAASAIVFPSKEVTLPQVFFTTIASPPCHFYEGTTAGRFGPDNDSGLGFSVAIADRACIQFTRNCFKITGSARPING